MKNWKLPLVAVAWLVMPAALPTRSIAAPGKSTPVKWEYCFVASNGFYGGVSGVAAYLPQGRRIFQPAGNDGYQAIAQVLNRLGDQGWEVLAYQDANGKKSWVLRRRK